MTTDIAGMIKAKLETALPTGAPHPQTIADLHPRSSLARLQAAAVGANNAVIEPAAKLRRWQQQLAGARAIVSAAQADPESADFNATAAAMATVLVLDGPVDGPRDAFGYGFGPLRELAARVRDLQDRRDSSREAADAGWGSYQRRLRDLEDAKRIHHEREVRRLESEIAALIEPT